jgi:D-alanyl-D-alanine carboxypeptidase
MGKVKKRKIKIKKKNFTIFIIIIILIIYSLVKITSLITTSFNKEKTEIKEEKKEVLTETQKKLNKLNNINEKIDYFNMDYLDRYIKYKNKNKNLSVEQVIKNVNMDLDLTKYEDIKKASNLNTEKVLVNKYNYLESDYVPDNLEEISNQYALSNMKLVSYAKEAFEKMASAASKENLNIVAMSTYRSYKYQVDLYNKYVKSDGKEAADTYSGRPGHSEHQTGLAVDVYNKEENYTNFEKTKEYEWMQEHASEYGFILRFPKDKEDETGYEFESWHYRYVGIKAAKYITENNISFEEYYATKIKDW